MILGFDPGKDKCGVAVMGTDNNISYHQVVPSETAISTIQSLCEQFPIDLLVMGDQTTSKSWKQRLTQSLSPHSKLFRLTRDTAVWKQRNVTGKCTLRRDLIA